VYGKRKAKTGLYTYYDYTLFVVNDTIGNYLMTELPVNTIVCRDSLEVMREWPSESVDMCVTSPPYWGLRDNQIEPSVWGGRNDCRHQWTHSFLPPTKNARQGSTETTKHPSLAAIDKPKKGQQCQKCGAWFGQLGLEPTPELYVQHLVEIFREVRRVLKKEGTLWLNLGDSYAANRTYQVHNTKDAKEHTYSIGSSVPKGLKAKDLVGIPWSVAFALRSDGWYLRQDIIWAKPNPMPESVQDRCTRSHEYVFLLSKNKKYYYDSESIKEPCAKVSIARQKRGISTTNKWIDGAPGQTPHTLSQPRTNDKSRSVSLKRNKRDVWTITVKSSGYKHFSSYPPDLIEPCVLAGCPKGGIVLDCFMGTGTTAAVALQHGRNYVGIDASPAYCKIAENRIMRKRIELTKLANAKRLKS
jgi:DNA modification methylase